MTTTVTGQGDTMAHSTFLSDLPLAGTLVGTEFEG